MAFRISLQFQFYW